MIGLLSDKQQRLINAEALYLRRRRAEEAACKGISTEALEAGVIEKLKDFWAMCGKPGNWDELKSVTDSISAVLEPEEPT